MMSETPDFLSCQSLPFASIQMMLISTNECNLSIAIKETCVYFKREPHLSSYAVSGLFRRNELPNLNSIFCSIEPKYALQMEMKLPLKVNCMFHEERQGQPNLVHMTTVGIRASPLPQV